MIEQLGLKELLRKASKKASTTERNSIDILIEKITNDLRQEPRQELNTVTAHTHLRTCFTPLHLQIMTEDI